MKKLKYFILLSVIMTSCYDKIMVDNNIFSVNTQILVFDNDNNPIQYAEVTISGNSYKSNNYLTDINGEVKCICREGEHQIYVSTYKDGLYYVSSEYAQIVAGVEQTLVYYPLMNFADSVIIRVFNKQNEKIPLSGINVALLKDKFYDNIDYYHPDFDILIKYKLLEGKTDENGIVVFKHVPDKYRFKVLLYKNKDDFTVDYDGFEVKYQVNKLGYIDLYFQ